MSHAHTRAKERIGCDISAHDMGPLKWLIRSGAATKARDLDDGCEIWMVFYTGKNVLVPVIYSPENDYIVTVLPRDSAMLTGTDYSTRASRVPR